MVASSGAVELATAGQSLVRTYPSGLEVYQPQAGALTASAKKIDYGSDDDKKRYKRRQKSWQDEAWRYYDECGEIWFAANFVANCLRKIRLYAAQQPDMGQPPTPIPTEAAGLPGQAVAEVERLGRADGGMGGIMAGFGLNLSVPGECVLVGREDKFGVERWKVHSTDEVFVNSAGKWATRGSPSDRKGEELPEDSNSYRIWRSHPRWSDQADSPMRPILDVVEELLILSRAIRATGRSRLAGAGMLLWPQEANLGGSAIPTQQSISGQAVDPVLSDLMNAMLTPIGDEGVAAAVVPLLAKLPGDRIEQVRHLVFERTIDPQMAAQRAELLKRIANGVDVPAQILLGIEDVNHWTGWLIDEQAFKAHLEPLVIQICGSLTAEFLRPNLGIIDPTDSDVLVWYDASALIGHPNRTQDTKDAHDRLLLSDKAAVKYLGFADADMPTEEEIRQRVARKALEKMGALRAGEALATATDAEATQTTVEPGPPASAGTEPDSSTEPAALAASVSRPALTAVARRPKQLGLLLARRDRELRVRLNERANASMFRALERAGASLRRRAARTPALKAMLADVDNWLVPSRLGPEVALELGVDQQAALEDAFGDLTMRFDRETMQAQQQLLQQLQDQEGGDSIDADVVAGQQSEDRRDATALLLAALLLLANDRLFSPHPSAPPLGEHDPDLLVPPGIIREALAVAGGAPAPAQLDGKLDEVSGGILTGDLALDLWKEIGLGPVGYEWITGAPDRPFEPHADLEGVQFASFDDDQLLWDGSEFPYVTHLFPGDHYGCQCDFAPLLEGSD